MTDRTPVTTLAWDPVEEFPPGDSRSSGEPCQCGSCRRARERDGQPCRACNGTRRVLSAVGEVRPCSRCDSDGFTTWSTRDA